MNKNYFLFLAFLSPIFFLDNDVYAQCNTTPCVVPVPSVDAQDACVLPNPAALNCYSGSTTLTPPVSFPPSWCTTIENNHCFAFTADSSTAVFRICTYGCAPGGAIQAAVLHTLDCINFQFVSPCLGNIASGTCQDLIASNLFVGEVYYLMIDGSAGAICNYTINGVGPIPVIEPAGPNSISFGDSITLDAGTDYMQFLWNTGDTTQQITVSKCGNYYVQAVDSSGCPVLSSSVIVSVSPIVTFSNGVLMSTPANTYQWLLNGDTIPGATGQTYHPTVSGDYSVQVDCPGTGWVESNLVPVAIVGISEANPWQMKIYPNPVSDTENKLTLEIQDIDIQSITLVLTDIAGGRFHEKENLTFLEKQCWRQGKSPQVLISCKRGRTDRCWQLGCL